MASRTIIVLAGQCLEDIALQEYGDQDGIRNLLFDNRATLTNGLCTRLTPGMELVIGGEPINKEAMQAMVKLGVVPATDDTDTTPSIGPGADYNNDHNDDHFVTAP